MIHSHSRQPDRSLRSRLVATVAAALAGGGVDAFYASGRAVVQGGSPAGPWRAVASGWLDRAAHDGAGPVVLGLATHFAIAGAMAAVWVFGLRRLAPVRRRPLAAAVVYGLGLYGVMYLVVLPLRWPGVFPRWEGMGSVLDVLAHIAVALCIALTASRLCPSHGQVSGARV